MYCYHKVAQNKSINLIETTIISFWFILIKVSEQIKKKWSDETKFYKSCCDEKVFLVMVCSDEGFLFT